MAYVVVSVGMEKSVLLWEVADVSGMGKATGCSSGSPRQLQNGASAALRQLRKW